MKTIITTLLICFSLGLAATTPNTAGRDGNGMNINEAINKAGLQRMLTQRIGKSYIAIVFDLDAEKHKQQMIATAEVFEACLLYTSPSPRDA